MPKESFADRLRAAMEKQNMKQVDLVRAAASAGVKLGKSHVSQYVSGKTVPRTDILIFLAQTLTPIQNGCWVTIRTAPFPNSVLPGFQTDARKKSAFSQTAESAVAPKTHQLLILNHPGLNLVQPEQTPSTGGITMREFKKSSKA